MMRSRRLGACAPAVSIGPNSQQIGAPEQLWAATQLYVSTPLGARSQGRPPSAGGLNPGLSEL
jgi:hypothetical protein